MQFKSQIAAFRAMVLSDILTQLHPSQNQIFLDNGDIRIMRVTVRLKKSGNIVLLQKQDRVRELQDAIITSNADQFASKGDVWNARNPQHDAYHGILVRTDKDGTRVHVDNEKPTICGFDDWGPVPIPAKVADPVVDRDAALARKKALYARVNDNLAIIHKGRGGLVRVK